MNQQTRKALAIVLDAAELTLHNESEDKEYHKQVAKAIKHLSAIWASAPTKFKGGYVNAYGNDIWVEDKGASAETYVGDSDAYRKGYADGCNAVQDYVKTYGE